MFTGAYTQALEISQCAEARVDFDLTDTFTVLLQVRHMAMQVTVTFVKFTNLTSLSGGSARVWPHAQISWVSEQVKLMIAKLRVMSALKPVRVAWLHWKSALFVTQGTHL